MSTLHDIPAVSQSLPDDVRKPLMRLIEGYRALAGFGKDPLLRAVTVGDARSGLIGTSPVVVTVPGGGGGAVEPDYTPPPTVTGLQVTAGFSYVTVEWDPPVYTEGRGHLQTNIYAAKRMAGDPLPTFASAERVYSAPGALTTAAIPSEMNTIWHVWAKWETLDNVESTSPAGGVNGETATTGQDVAQLLDVLEGQITGTQLHADLASPIALITAPASTAGSVDQRIAVVSARLNSGGDVATAIVSAQATATTANTTATGAAADAASALSSATSTASLLTTLQASIAGAGGNLLPNSSFEVDPSADGIAAGWTFATTGEVATVSQVTGRTGGLAQRIAWTGTNTGVKSIFTDSALNEGGIPGGIRGGWQPNKTYVASWYARASSGAAGFTMENRWNTAPAATTALLNPPLSSSAWQRYAYRITTGATVEPNGRLYIALANAAPAVGHIDIDDAMVQEGDLLTGYQLGDQAALTASLQQEVTTRASQTGALFAQWTVKTDINGYVSGFGLASTANNATPTSAFIVRADSFAVSSPSGPGITPITPFIVRTTPTTINGVAVPVGVYMSAAYLQNGEITNAKIGNLQVDDAKMANVSVAKLIAGSLQVGSHIRSTSYVAGVSGFSIEANGDIRSAQFNIIGGAATFAGALSAASGTFAGALSAATGTFAGSLSAATGTFAGALSAATGTFAGSLSAATGTFSGSLTAATGSFFSSTSGQRITINESSSNEARFYGNRGDGTITQMASIGINTVGSDSVVIAVGDTASGNSRVGLLARSNTARAIQGHSVSGQGLYGVSTSAEGVWGQSTSNSGVMGISSSAGASTAGVVGTNSSAGPGVHGISTSGHGGQFYGNASRAALRLEPQTFPSVGAAGSICIASGDLYFHNGSGWRVVQSFAI